MNENEPPVQKPPAEDANVENKPVLVFQGKRGTRLDVFVSESTPLGSRRYARDFCAQGLVRVNGQKKNPGFALSPGDMIEFLSSPERPRARPELAEALGEQAPRVLYEDEDLLALDKPRGTASVVHRAGDPVTLADLIARYFPPCRDASPDSREAGLVQRLDFHTGGAIVAAKTREMWTSLRELFQHGGADKVYFALVEGDPGTKPFEINFPLLIERDAKEVRVLTAGEEEAGGAGGVHAAETFVRPAGSFYGEALRGTLALVEVRGQRMLRHQIRAHLAAKGFPLAGDRQYGSQYAGYEAIEHGNHEVRPGFFLHAYSIAFVHPRTGAEVRIICHSPELESYARL